MSGNKISLSRLMTEFPPFEFNFVCPLQFVNLLFSVVFLLLSKLVFPSLFKTLALSPLPPRSTVSSTSSSSSSSTGVPLLISFLVILLTFSIFCLPY